MAVMMEDMPLYERQRAENMARNRAALEAMGIVEQKTLLQSFAQSKPIAPRPKKKKPATAMREGPARKSRRLENQEVEYKPLALLPDEIGGGGTGRVQLPKGEGIVAGDDERLDEEAMLEFRCHSKGRGSVYDSVAGICCHFCRQKKLCGEEGCPRCSTRDVEKECIGKSECTKCHSATGKFCRACLTVRYGLILEDVRADKGWLCPHCYEDEHPDEDWICNSSICMSRRGLKPTGIIIHEARARGFPSAAHMVRAQRRELKAQRGVKAAAGTVAAAAGVVAKAKAKERGEDDIILPRRVARGGAAAAEANPKSKLKAAPADHKLKRPASRAAAAQPAKRAAGAKGKGKGKGKEPEVFTVECILGSKAVKGKTMYLTKWRGYGEAENSWEPRSSFDAPSMDSYIWRAKKPKA